MVVFSSGSPIVFRGCSTLCSRSFMAPNLQPPTCQPPSLTNSSPQAGPLDHSQITLVKTAPFPPAVSPAGDYVSNVCLCHWTLSPPTVGGFTFVTALTPFVDSLNKYLLSTHSMRATVLGVSYSPVEKKMIKIPAFWSLPPIIDRGSANLIVC